MCFVSIGAGKRADDKTAEQETRRKRGRRQTGYQLKDTEMCSCVSFVATSNVIFQGKVKFETWYHRTKIAQHGFSLRMRSKVATPAVVFIYLFHSIINAESVQL